MYKAFLIKYGEIGIKGKNRYLFEYALMDQIKFSLRKVDGQFEVTKEQGSVNLGLLIDQLKNDEIDLTPDFQRVSDYIYPR